MGVTCEECFFESGAGAGIGGSGSMPFGTATSTGMAIQNCRPLTANSVLLEYTGIIENVNPQNQDSPLYAGNWTLTAIDPLTAKIRLIQTIVLQNVTGLGGELVIFFDGVLTEQAVYRLDVDSPEVAASGCDCCEFMAIKVHPSAKEEDNRDDDGFIDDIANPSRFVDALSLQPITTYQITDTGDLALDGGLAGYRKRIVRRVESAFGSFFHMPSYGTELEVKSLLTANLALRIQSKISAQVLKEPETLAVNVVVSQPARAVNILSVNIRATTQSGQVVDVAVPIELP